MLLDRYFDELFHRPAPRIPSRLVRYGIIYGDSAKNALNDFEPKFDPLLKAQAELLVEKLTAFIEAMEAYENETVDGPKEEDDAKAEVKAKAKTSKRKP